jgi:hypothetical protein
MEPLSLDSVVVASRDQVAADLESEVIILGLHDGVYYGVHGVASRVWALVQHPTALRDVLTTLLAEFDVDEATCRADMLAFVAELAQKGLVTRVRDGG